MSSGGGYEKGHLSAGPWGSRIGAHWDDGVYCGVRQLVINHGSGIDSIQIEYDKRGRSVWSDKHGGRGGLRTDKVKLDYPDEFLISVSGHYGTIDSKNGSIVIGSLCFETNKGRRHGPFGIPQGTPFSTSPIAGGKVVGFHGRSSWHLDSIGVYLKPLLHRNVTANDHSEAEKSGCDISIAKEVDNMSISKRPVSNEQKEANWHTSAPKPMSYGPWGGNGGIPFSDGVYTGVREIHLTRSGGVTSIRVCYDLNGQPVWGIKNGGTGGIRLDKVVLNYPSEYLTHITGYYGSTIFRGPTVVKSLTFHTNKRKHGPFGEEQGRSFSSASAAAAAADDSKGEKQPMVIVGFHGRKGWFVDSIGVHTTTIHGKPPHHLPQQPLPNGSHHIISNPHTSMVAVKEPMMMMMMTLGGSGPWGGEGGKPWDDGVFSGVRKVFLTEKDSICSLQFEYDRNGQSVWSVQHGTNIVNSISHWIKLHHPHEVLTCISGYCSTVGGGEESTKVIKSLTFHSNRGQYGPYGEEMGTFFSSMKTQGKIVGFYGKSSGTHLNAIGVHMQHWLEEQRATATTTQAQHFKSALHKIFTS